MISQTGQVHFVEKMLWILIFADQIENSEILKLILKDIDFRGWKKQQRFHNLQ